MKSIPKFSVQNPVLVNIVMLTLLFGGAYAGLTLIREMFPESRPNVVLITAPYPGATPLEVEKGLALRIEEAVKDIDHIDKIITQIGEGLSTTQVEMTSEADDIDQVVNDFKAAIDTIPRDELPEEAEEIRVTKVEPRLPVIAVTIFGDADERTRKVLGERLRDDLLLLPEISDVELGGIRKAELAVEIEPEKLVEYGTSLAEVAAAIRAANLDLPGGQVKTTRQNVSVRTLGETDDADRIAQTIVRTTANGELVRVQDLGQVIDGFEDVDTLGRFNGKSAVSATVYKTGSQDAIHIADRVKAFAAGKARQPLELDWLTRLKSAIGVSTDVQQIYQQAYNDPYPGNITIRTHSNLARFIESRLDLLKRNGAWGLALVFLSLLFFLNVRVAFWVMMGLVLSVCGAVVLMSLLGETLNLISMFGLIVVLGLIVDDAIVVAENIYHRVERGENPRSAAITGTQEVTWPVIIAVCTTIGAFVPLMFIEGRMGDFMGVLPVVVMCALGVSLIEAFSILPSHLAEALKPLRNKLGRAQPQTWAARIASPLRRAEEHFVLDVLSKHYKWLVSLAVRNRYVTMAAVTMLLLITLGLVAGRRVPLVFIQEMDSETIEVSLDMPIGTPAERTLEAMSVIENACLQTPEVETVFAIVGARIQADTHGVQTTQISHLAQLFLELQSVEERHRSSDDVITELRARTAGIPGINSLRYQSRQGGPGGAEIEIEITGENMPHILTVTESLKTTLANYQGVYDLTDDYQQGSPELQIELLDSARPLGLTTRSLATEIRGAFYGLEARTLQRGREDVDIRVRFPENRRKHVYELESMRVATPSGHTVPFCEVARLVESRGPAAVRRVDQRRAVVVTADVDQRENNAEDIIADLLPTIARLERDYPGLRINFAGNKREMAKSFGSLKRDFVIALIIIYFMLAGLFRSYIQPVVVLTAVPFGLNGVIAGHLLMGYPLTMLSMIGTVALTGIVVNDALILVDFINKEIAAGKDVRQAVIAGGVRRLRPILLTSLTTILGLAPLMTETSFQAKFLIPMAISISFGLAFATVLTLIVVPANYVIVHDLKLIARRIWHGPRPRPTEAEPA
jgi:multidrug efflux pump subunit AcrB